MPVDREDVEPGPAAHAAAGARELTPRALAVGLLIGVLLCIANVYMGLKTGWWDSGSITASILAFALLSTWGRGRHRRQGALEDNLAQAVAASAGAMPAAAGLLGAIPALELLGRAPPYWAVGALGFALAVLGILIGLALRRRLLEQEALPFPTGVATSEVIAALHSGRGGASRALTLAGSSAASGAVLLLRDLANLVPQVSSLPGTIRGLSASALGIGLAWSPLLAGVGIVAGAQTGLSVALGAAVAWIGLAPLLVQSGRVPGPEYASLAAWLSWPGVALVLGASLTSVAGLVQAFRASLADLGSAGARRARRMPRVRLGSSSIAVAVLVVALVIVVLIVARRGFGLGLLEAGGALAVSILLASVCARAVGQTDIAPVAEMGQITQGISGVLAPGHAALNVAAGHIVAGEAAQVGVTLWSLQAGRRLGASPTQLARGMVLGAACGAAVAVPAYLLLLRAHGLATSALPAPFAIQWKAVAALMSGGPAALPAGAGAAAAVALVAGAVLEALARRRGGRCLPSPAAVGMGFIMPASYAAAIVVGSLAAAALRRARPDLEPHLPSLGAGAIAGESTVGFVVAALIAAGLVRAG